MHTEFLEGCSVFKHCPMGLVCPCRELAEMDAEDERALAEMEELKKTERTCLEILKKYE